MDKDRLIVAQVAAKAAVELKAAGDQRNIGELAGEIQDMIYRLAGAQIGASDFAAGSVTVIPETVQVYDSAAATVSMTPEQMVDAAFTSPSGQAPVNMAAIPAPQPINENSPPEVLWANALFHAPNDWYDNTGEPRASKNGGKGPDFRHKTLKQGQYNLGLWIKSGDTPDWAKNKLGN
jgi:hypothetical protein